MNKMNITFAADLVRWHYGDYITTFELCFLSPSHNRIPPTEACPPAQVRNRVEESMPHEFGQRQRLGIRDDWEAGIL